MIRGTVEIKFPIIISKKQLQTNFKLRKKVLQIIVTLIDHIFFSIGNPKNKVCPECDTAFKVPIGLKHHLLLHTGELPFLCLHCWRSFSSHIGKIFEVSNLVLFSYRLFFLYFLLFLSAKPLLVIKNFFVIFDAFHFQT